MFSLIDTCRFSLKAVDELKLYLYLSFQNINLISQHFIVMITSLPTKTTIFLIMLTAHSIHTPMIKSKRIIDHLQLSQECELQSLVLSVYELFFLYCSIPLMIMQFIVHCCRLNLSIFELILWSFYFYLLFHNQLVIVVNLCCKFLNYSSENLRCKHSLFFQV